MMIPLFLCLYLLLFVWDVVLLGVRWGSDVLIRGGWFHLILFLVLIVLFRTQFAQLAEKHQTKIVFNPRVYAFFAAACGACLAAIFAHPTFVQFLSRTILLGLFAFRCGAWMFGFFPVKNRHFSYARTATYVLGIGALAVLLGPSVRGLLTEGITFSRSNQTSNAFDTKKTTTYTLRSVGVPHYVETREVVEDDQFSGIVVETGGVYMSGEDVASGVSEGIVQPEGTDNPTIDISAPLTYRVLLPYLNDQNLLKAINDRPVFTQIGSEDPLYQSFQRAWGMKMIGTNVNPNRQVRCENLMVIFGLSHGWNIDTSLPLLSAYRQAAQERDVLGSCTTRTQIATQEMIQ